MLYVWLLISVWPQRADYAYESWPFFKDWAIIFGKDRATGDTSEQMFEAVNDLFRKDKGKSHVSSCSQDVESPPPSSFQEESEFISDSWGTSASSPNRNVKSVNKRQRTRNDAVTPVADMISSFFEKIDSKLGELVNKVGFEHDLQMMRQQVIDAVEPIPTLTEENKMKVAMLICEKPQLIGLFLHVNDTKRKLMARMILDGNYE